MVAYNQAAERAAEKAGEENFRSAYYELSFAFNRLQRDLCDTSAESVASLMVRVLMRRQVETQRFALEQESRLRGLINEVVRENVRGVNAVESKEG